MPNKDWCQSFFLTALLTHDGLQFKCQGFVGENGAHFLWLHKSQPASLYWNEQVFEVENSCQLGVVDN